MKTNHRGSLWLLLPAILIIGFGCAKTKDIASDSVNDTRSRSVLNSSKYYYYYKGEKQHIELNTEYISVLANETKLTPELKRGIVRSAHLKNKVLKTITGFENVKRMEIKLTNLLSEKNYEKLLDELIQKKFAQSVSPYFKNKEGDKVGLSNYFYVKLRSKNDFANLSDMAKTHKVVILEEHQFIPLWYTLSITQGSSQNALETANLFFESGLFEHAEPEFIFEKLTTASDPYYPNQWNLNNTGQYGGTPGMDIKIESAHAISKGQNVNVAVIDMGIDGSNPDLSNNIHTLGFDTENRTSPGMIYNFTNNPNHGTPVAGIIGADDNNDGLLGVAPDCQLMSVSSSLWVTEQAKSDLAAGIEWAWQNGADVINNSWGHNLLQSSLIDAAISNALSLGRNGKGCVVIFSAGNTNGSVIYPANSNADIITVGAMSPCGQRKSPSSCDSETSWGSSYGVELDIVAPGVLIPSTDLSGTGGYNPNTPIHPWSGGTKTSTDYPLQNYTIWFNGTSAAAPQVSGVAALVLSTNPNLTQQQVATIIEQTAQKVGSYSYATTTGRPNGTWHNEMGYGLLNAFAAVSAASSCSTVYYNGQTVNTNTNIAGCRIESTNVTVNSGAKLTFSALDYILIPGDFEVKSGAEFEAHF